METARQVALTPRPSCSDVGFREDEASRQCVREGEVDPYAVPTNCTEGAFYRRTKGYRRVSGDTCEGGRLLEYAPDEISCPLRSECTCHDGGI